eukprot:194731-Pyramimonas_sp.AAC.3
MSKSDEGRPRAHPAAPPRESFPRPSARPSSHASSPVAPHTWALSDSPQGAGVHSSNRPLPQQNGPVLTIRGA